MNFRITNFRIAKFRIRNVRTAVFRILNFTTHGLQNNKLLYEDTSAEV